MLLDGLRTLSCPMPRARSSTVVQRLLGTDIYAESPRLGVMTVHVLQVVF